MLKKMYSKVKGAVFVTRSTDFSDIRIWDAKHGIEKLHGCVFFLPVQRCRRVFSIYLTPKEVKEIYYDCPKREEAWLVTPKGKHWVWEQVDTQIEFS